MNRKNGALAFLLLSGVLVSAAFLNVNPSFINRGTNAGRGDDNSLVLNSSTNTGATASYGNGTFTVATAGGNDIDFAYNYAKESESGLITLGKSTIGYVSGNHYFLENTKAITSITGITISFTQNTKLAVFASNDGVDFKKIEILTASRTFTTANDYFYFRFVNCNSNDAAIDIQSITFNYACIASDYTDELSDLTSKKLEYPGDCESFTPQAVTKDTTSFDSGFNSARSLRITAPTNDIVDNSTNMWKYGFWMPLPRSYTVAEMHNMSISFSYNTANNTDFDSGHKFARLCFYLAPNSYSYKDGAGNAVELKAELANASSGWVKTTYDFDKATNFDVYDSTLMISHLLVRPCYIVGYVGIDQLRVSFNEDYPSFDDSAVPTDSKEVNDITNNAINLSNGCAEGPFNYEIHSKNSLRSKEVKPSTDSCRFFFQGFLIDCKGIILEFDIKTPSATAYATLNLYHSDGGVDKRYTCNARYGTEAWASIESYTGDYAGWKHYVIDCDEILAAASGVTVANKPLSNPANFGIGLNHSNSETFYVDNFTVTAKSAA